MTIQDDFTEKIFWKQRLSFDSFYKMPNKVKNIHSQTVLFSELQLFKRSIKNTLMGT